MAAASKDMPPKTTNDWWVTSSVFLVRLGVISSISIPLLLFHSPLARAAGASSVSSQLRRSFPLSGPDQEGCQPRQPHHHAFLDTGFPPCASVPGSLSRIPVLRQATAPQLHPECSLHGSVLPDMADIRPVSQAREPHRVGVTQAARAGNTPCSR